MLSLLLLAFTTLASQAPAAPDLRLEPAPQLTEASTLGLAIAPLASLLPQDPFPPGTTPPTCQELLDQIADLEVEIAQLLARSQAALDAATLMIDLKILMGCNDTGWFDIHGNYVHPPVTAGCQALSDAISALFELAEELYLEAQAKELALQQLIALLAVYC